MNQPLNKNCPICGGYVYMNTIGTEICSNCGYVLPSSNFATSDYSHNTTGSAYKYCQNCNTKMEPFGDGSWWSCPKCGYGYMDYIGDLPKELSDEEVEMSKKIFEGKLHIPCDNTWGICVGKINTEDLMSNTLQFDRCERIIFRNKTLDFQFEIPEEQYKDIDTIIVNGHKFVREKNI